MLGAIVGDVVGSVYEAQSTKKKNFPLFTDTSRMTDDTVLTAATADALLLYGGDPSPADFAAAYRLWGKRYPYAGYGGNFKHWIHHSKTGPYNSWGNGSSMRVSPVGWTAESEKEALRLAEASALPTHNHPEGVKGAQATALAVYLARTGASKEDIRGRLTSRFGYDLDRAWKDIQPGYAFEISCQKSVPEALIAFLDSDSFEDAIRNAIALGGDADTQAAIAGAVAEAFYGGVPEKFLAGVLPRLPQDLLLVCMEFAERFLSAPSIGSLRREVAIRETGESDGLYDKFSRYSVLLSAETRRRIASLAADINQGRTEPGERLKKRLDAAPVSRLDADWLLWALLRTKRPCIFAESEIAGDGSDWTREELSLLGDISIAVPVRVFDDGLHSEPSVHSEPFSATLVYTPGALLADGRGGEPVDSEVVADGEIDAAASYALYRRRLLPVFKYISAAALKRERPAVITIPGLGCGQFAGRFRDRLYLEFGETLLRLVRDHAGELTGIRLLRYDPYRKCPELSERFGETAFRVCPLSSSERGLPQLCRPETYAEPGDDFGECDLYSIVAWDHASWPGNDFYRGARATDDGVKAAATDTMYRMSGIRGSYSAESFTYDPPAGYADWEEVVRRNELYLRAVENVVVVAGESGGEELEEL